MPPPLCAPGQPDGATLVLWGTAWRADQKEPADRQAKARRAIERFFAAGPCGSVDVMESANGRPAPELSDAEALRFAASRPVAPVRVILLRVEELGPLLIVHPSPILWEGGTEARIRARVLDTATGRLRADVATHWRDTGAFVLRGVNGLEDDMTATLRVLFGTRPTTAGALPAATSVNVATHRQCS